MTRYIISVLMTMAMWSIAIAQDFNPDSPGEPGVPDIKVKLTVLADPAAGGTVSGSGMYSPGTEVQLTASSYNQYRFVGWTDADGTVVGSEKKIKVIKKAYPETYVAHFQYDPAAPGEPNEAVTQVYYRLDVVAGYGGTANGGGRYQPGQNVTVRAYPSTGFRFDRWVNGDGETMSTESLFAYTTQAFNETLTALFVYDPSLPNEPGEPRLSHTITLSAGEGGTCSFASKRALEGESVNIVAYANSGYRFDAWYIGDEVFSTDRNTYIVVPNHSVSLQARFIFVPDAPGEPMSPDGAMSFYWMSSITYPGTSVELPLFFTTLGEVGDMTFRMSVSQDVTPHWESVKMLPAIDGYTATVTPDAQNPSEATLTLVGSTLSNGSFPLLTLAVDIPSDAPTPSKYQVKINQVSITKADGETVTATTRNGHIQLYELGDNNGDGNVDILDAVNMSLYLLTDGKDNDVFIEEVSDTNEDGQRDLLDTVNILEIILSK